ncbi:hypothetical protein HRW16_09710 [Streptomyces lunaelactis]|uniref:hypothetical protein n=1 Tax=Streptomyces lunaelactis TaxID=1535768 RepID=UPI001584643E|nr:hypothetical protein [Streptomyces lunaelactis]NUK35064.1 hypothetical protein [Streptomyces lunaelactis]NUK44663.1 hypothetical protein [Streptomyces lunaelactis]NUK92129.1 hypothetical protein [Streptomyces lunaelactis]NUL29894.1 hypothetical protein [Streptomyces lunaelactis]
MSVRKALRIAPLVDNIPGLHLLALGEAWDVVRVRAEAGFVALARLRATEERLGPVLYDRPSQRLYYAVPTGSRATWSDLPVRFLSSGSWLVAPNPYRADDWFGGWCELPNDDALTDPDALRHAIEALPAETVTRPEPAAPKENPRWKPLNAPDWMPTSDGSPRASRLPSGLPRS